MTHADPLGPEIIDKGSPGSVDASAIVREGSAEAVTSERFPWIHADFVPTKDQTANSRIPGLRQISAKTMGEAGVPGKTPVLEVRDDRSDCHAPAGT